MTVKISDEQKAKFIESNMQLIPKKSQELFNTWDLSKKYLKVQEYVRKSKKKSNSSVSIVKAIDSYLKKKDCDITVISKVVEKCNKWLESNKKKELDDIQRQIEQLQEKQRIIMGGES